jgi:Ca2+:H+ antiporter
VAAIGGALHYATDEDVATFVVCAFALAGLAWLVALGTESIGSRFGPAVTGVLQSTLGNLPELFVVLFALSAGETVVAQTSILGSLFANALLVLGLAIVAGARVSDGGVMRFGARLPNDTAILTLLAVFLIVVLGLSDRVGDRASHHTVAISVIGAVVLLSVYAVWLPGYLRSDQPAADHEGSEAALSLPVGLGLLAAAGVAAALVSDWFIAALDPAVKSIGISKAFTGLVIVGIAGNAVENVVGITLAAKGKSDLALSVVKNSVSQIAVFLYPVLVLASLFFATRLTFVVNPVLTGALALTAIAMWAITGDGKAAAFEGWALAGFYVILAALVWYE